MVCILLSTYNGEKYLEEQLESLVRQEGVEIRILVRDDGSKDATCDILNKWQDKGALTWYTGSNLGFALSFMDLLRNAPEADYYAFCDQDDIWLPDKMKVAIKKLSQLPDGPNLYCSNLCVYRDGEIRSLIRAKFPRIDVHSCLITNCAVGCTSVFNGQLRDMVLRHFPTKLYAHDWWMFQTAVLFGSVYYDLIPHILYRQHGNNQIGARSTFRDKWKKRMEEFLRKERYGVMDIVSEELLNCYSSLLSPEQRKIISEFTGYRENGLKRLRLFFSRKYVKERLSNTVWLKLRILIGR